MNTHPNGKTPNPHIPAGQELFVSVILDRSGSMSAIRDDAIGGFNGLLDDLKAEPARTLLTLTQFDSQSIDLLCDGIDVSRVHPLTAATFVPRGSTPLLDSVGKTLAATEARVRELHWMGHILVVIITDGQENASVEWRLGALRERIDDLQARGWGFLYMGADANAYADAQQMGIGYDKTARWAHKGEGARAMSAQVAYSIKKFRTGQREDLITPEERERVERA